MYLHWTLIGLIIKQYINIEFPLKARLKVFKDLVEHCAAALQAQCGHFPSACIIIGG